MPVRAPQFAARVLKPPSAHIAPDAPPRPPHTTREGYEEGLSTTHKAAPAAEFLTSPNPVEMLGRLTALHLDGPLVSAAAGAAGEGRAAFEALCAGVKAHPATNGEVKALLGDLQARLGF